MSRIGQKPITLPSHVQCTQEGLSISVKGPKGELHMSIHPLISVEIKEEEGKTVLSLSVSSPEKKEERALWGTTRALLQNMVLGVTTGFEKSLEVIGVGYRVNPKGKDLVLDVGYSHPVPFILPEGIEAKIENNIVTIRGMDCQRVGEVAAQIRRIRRPEPYKGKGIKYVDEVIRRKAGKTAST